MTDAIRKVKVPLFGTPQIEDSGEQDTTVISVENPLDLAILIMAMQMALWVENGMVTEEEGDNFVFAVAESVAASMNGGSAEIIRGETSVRASVRGAADIYNGDLSELVVDEKE